MTGPDAQNELRVLNWSIKRTEHGIQHGSHHRHADRLIEELGLRPGQSVVSRALRVPCKGRKKDADDEEPRKVHEARVEATPERVPRKARHDDPGQKPAEAQGETKPQDVTKDSAENNAKVLEARAEATLEHVPRRASRPEGGA